MKFLDTLMLNLIWQTNFFLVTDKKTKTKHSFKYGYACKKNPIAGLAHAVYVIALTFSLGPQKAVYLQEVRIKPSLNELI